MIRAGAIPWSRPRADGMMPFFCRETALVGTMTAHHRELRAASEPPRPDAEAPRPLPSGAAELAAIHALVGDRLAEVEASFRSNLASPTRIVQELGAYVAAGEGKRVRPTLHLLACRMCGYDGPHDVLMATVLEFIHCATLIHDDIIDESKTRRSRPSVNAAWGNSVTVLFGDYMFAKAMEMALGAGSLEIMSKLAEATLRMTEGEMLQTRYVGRLDLTVDEYLALVERKTAALFACCCEIAGLLSGADRKRLAALRGYGTELGLAFQLVDDVLDFTGDPRRLGKPAASDLREGKATFAVLDLLSRGGEEEASLVRRVMHEGRPGMPEIAALTSRLEGSGALDRALDRARHHAGHAIAFLEPFPDGPARRCLASLPELLVFRDR